jgi:hypothetical protein
VIPIEPLRGWRTGRYRRVASSAAAKGEWDAFVRKLPKAMKGVYERLSEHPLDVYGTRQFPLKGKRNKPFWEYEISGGDRLYYAVDLHQQVIVVSVMPHATRSEAMTKRVRDRRDAFDGLVAEQQAEAALHPPEPPAPVRSRRRKR